MLAQSFVEVSSRAGGGRDRGILGAIARAERALTADGHQRKFWIVLIQMTGQPQGRRKEAPRLVGRNLVPVLVPRGQIHGQGGTEDVGVSAGDAVAVIGAE